MRKNSRNKQNKKLKKIISLIPVVLVLLYMVGSYVLPRETFQVIRNFVEVVTGEDWGGSNVSLSGKMESDVDLSNIPPYSGSPFVVLEDNVPTFDEADFGTSSFEEYPDLDHLGRCVTVYANLGYDLMPTESRGDISSVKPSGWINKPYDNVDGTYLYNRCHLIGFQLAGENANERNLITGTRYMNVDGMLPFENIIADYIKETKNHVLYCVSPIYDGDNLVASGVQMQAKSVEDNGEGVLFNVYVYNVQPDICIDYATGDNWAE